MIGLFYKLHLSNIKIKINPLKQNVSEASRFIRCHMCSIQFAAETSQKCQTLGLQQVPAVLIKTRTLENWENVW